MSEKTSSSNSGGIGFVGLLTIAFIVLKLTGYIDWSWWWVWSPVLIGWGVVFLAFIVFFLSFLTAKGSR
jgi:hypothetical protein